MGKWSFSDFMVVPLLAIGCYWVYTTERDADNRPEYVKYIEDPRNGCALKNELLLANHQTHVAKADYRPKVLRIYDCANRQVAATIEEE